MDIYNPYTMMQKIEYSNGTSNHEEHNNNKDYWDILLSDVKNKEDWKDKKALDFACGKGRNVTNLLSLADWSRVDGVDLSEANIYYCKEEYANQNSEWYGNSGVDLDALKSEEYDFVMSTIALQHIPVHEIRRSLMKEILRVMKPGAVFSFQMAYGPVEKPGGNPAAYYDNTYFARGTNSSWDVRVNDEQQVQEDLEEIGFQNVLTEVRDPFSDTQHPNWIYVRCQKPEK